MSILIKILNLLDNKLTIQCKPDMGINNTNLPGLIHTKEESLRDAVGLAAVDETFQLPGDINEAYLKVKDGKNDDILLSRKWGSQPLLQKGFNSHGSTISIWLIVP